MDAEHNSAILARHAAGLLRGDDQTERLAHRHPELRPLLLLARALQRALVPVRVSAEFSTTLRTTLLAGQQPEAATPRRQPDIVWVSALVGSILSIIGLTLLWLRRLRGGHPRSRPATAA